jgi:hypothetical protein
MGHRRRGRTSPSRQSRCQLRPRFRRRRRAPQLPQWISSVPLVSGAREREEPIEILFVFFYHCPGAILYRSIYYSCFLFALLRFLFVRWLLVPQSSPPQIAIRPLLFRSGNKMHSTVWLWTPMTVAAHHPFPTRTQTSWPSVGAAAFWLLRIRSFLRVRQNYCAISAKACRDDFDEPVRGKPPQDFQILIDWLSSIL